MPITWCYDVESNQKFCSTGFPLGCYVSPAGKQKDACVISVSHLNAILSQKPLNVYVVACHWFQGMLTAADTYYVFNHVDIVIEYHTSLNTDWGRKAPDDAVRLVRAKLEPRR